MDARGLHAIVSRAHPLDEAALRASIRGLVKKGVESIAGIMGGEASGEVGSRRGVTRLPPLRS